ncbi:PAS domain S-box protein [Thiorhodovibrio winogradskyi]|uniref:PAS domain S-box protein n=1 Tax=Thiorhodovibrio winogradskyi TaxID=77007 RepID=UPI002E2DBDBB|nr:PAS domain S-box protein [Thiorhodovibrio winogradskyi]
MAAWQKAMADVLDPEVWRQIAPLYSSIRKHLDALYILGEIDALKAGGTHLIQAPHLTSSNMNDCMMMRIIHATPLALCVTNEQGIFEYANPAYCMFYGYAPSELIGNHFTKVVPPASRQKLIELHDQFVAGGSEIRGEWTVVDRAGASHTILADAVKIIGEDGRPRKVAFVIDITERKETEAALRESQARFARLTSQLADRLFFFTNAPDGELLYLSEGFKQLTGSTITEEAIGQSWRNLADWSPESLTHAIEESRRWLSQGGEKARFELSFCHPSGDWRLLEIHAYRIFDQARARELIEGIALDITEQRALDARLRTLARSVEHAPVSITVTDGRSNILYVNPYFTQLSGYTSAEAIGKNPRILKSDEQSPAFYEAMWATLQQGETWRGELINKNKQGQFYWVETTISPVFDEQGVLQNYVAVTQDIKDRKELERIKEDVERIMRHDLKTPLNAVINVPEVLLLDEGLSADQREDIQLIRESGRRMLDLIDLSLDMFKIESGQFAYHASPVNLVNIMQTVSTFIEQPLKRKQLSLSMHHNGQVLSRSSPVDRGPSVAADARLLLSMLGNLLANAVEASPLGATIILAIRDHDAADDHVLLEIVNQGAVPKAIRERFFTKYSTHGKSNGTGLGTYSAKLMADTMGFELTMTTSDAEDRTCIRLRMPPSNVSPVAAVPPGASGPDI